MAFEAIFRFTEPEDARVDDWQSVMPSMQIGLLMGLLDHLSEEGRTGDR